MRHRILTASLLLALAATSTVAWTTTTTTTKATTSRSERHRRSPPPPAAIAAAPGTRMVPPLRMADPNQDTEQDNGDPDNEEDCAQEDECEIDWSKMPGASSGSSGTATASAAHRKPQQQQQSSSSSSSSNNNSPNDNESTTERLRALLERQFKLDSHPQYSSMGKAKANMQTLLDHEYVHYHEEEEEEDKLSASSSSAAAAAASSQQQHSASSTTNNNTSHRARLELAWGVRHHGVDNDECDVYQPATCGGHACLSCDGRGHCTCRFCRGTKHFVVVANGSAPTTKAATLFLPCTVCNAAGVEACRPCQGSGWIADWTSLGVQVGALARPGP